ncbi:oxygen-dependent choline dehydrogenase [Tanacetum coccineum]
MESGSSRFKHFGKLGRSGPLAYGVAFEDSLLNTHIACLKDEQKDEIILSVGALGSPQLLVLSDIGPRKQLDALKIKVVLRDMKRVWLKKKKQTNANLKKGQGINEYVWKDVTMLNATLLETRAKLLLTRGYFDYGEEVMHFSSSRDRSSTSSLADEALKQSEPIINVTATKMTEIPISSAKDKMMYMGDLQGPSEVFSKILSLAQGHDVQQVLVDLASEDVGMKGGDVELPSPELEKKRVKVGDGIDAWSWDHESSEASRFPTFVANIPTVD